MLQTHPLRGSSFCWEPRMMMKNTFRMTFLQSWMKSVCVMETILSGERRPGNSPHFCHPSAKTKEKLLFHCRGVLFWGWSVRIPVAFLQVVMVWHWGTLHQIGHDDNLTWGQQNNSLGGLKDIGTQLAKHCHYERDVAGSNPVHAACYRLPVLRAQLALLSLGG